MASYIKNLLEQLPFYGKTIKPRIKEFTNTKLLSELPFFERYFIHNQIQIFLILPLIQHQILTLLFIFMVADLLDKWGMRNDKRQMRNDNWEKNK